MVSLAAIIYLVARAVPRIDESAFSNPLRKSFFDNLVSKLPLEKIDLMVDNLFEKTLRKFKIVVMKLDNVLTKRLSSFKPTILNEKETRPNIFENNISESSEEKKEVE